MRSEYGNTFAWEGEKGERREKGAGKMHNLHPARIIGNLWRNGHQFKLFNSYSHIYGFKRTMGSEISV